MNHYMMALDQGTTSSRCILFDRKGSVISKAQKEIRQNYPQPGWVEQDPVEIWASQYAVLKEAQAAMDISSGQIAGIGITNQRETTIVWNRYTGEPVYPAIVWQCRRTSKRMTKLQEDGMVNWIKERTGLIPDAYFSASKIEWILEHVPGARKAAENGELLFGTVDTWLIWKLTKGAVHVTDYTNASRTMLFDIQNLCWDKKILDYFGIPDSMLPEVKTSSTIYGMADADLMGAPIPIAGVAGDQQAALFGQCCFEKGAMKNTYGTGCFLLMHTGTDRIQSQHGLLTTIAADDTDQIQYALEGSVFAGGAAVQWLRDGMQLFEDASQTEEMARRAENTNGVYVVPAFSGLGAPYWNADARGTVVGITRGCTREHLVRATLESIAYQVYDVICAMEEDVGVKFESLKVDGGASANDFLMQFQAEITDRPVERPVCIETTALGAAYLAGLAVGYWKNKEDIRKNWQLSCKFEPRMKQEDRKRLLKGWKRAIRCALVWAQEDAD